MRKSFDGLCGIVKGDFQKDVLEGDYFVFFNRVLDRCKILLWDRDGLMLVYKRLEKGCFQRVAYDGESLAIEVDATTLTLILSGIDLGSAKRRKRFSVDKPVASASRREIAFQSAGPFHRRPNETRFHSVNHSAFFFLRATCFIICVATIWDMMTPQQLEEAIANFTQVAAELRRENEAMRGPHEALQRDFALLNAQYLALSPIVAAPALPSIIEGCKYDFSVIAAVVGNKFAFHMPTYREQDFFGQCGWYPSRSTATEFQ